MPVSEAESDVAGPGQRREESVRRRARILAAARRCFGHDGYGGATVARIAQEADVSNGLLYQFFRSKEHLFEVVLEEVLRDWVRALVPKTDDELAAQALDGMLRRGVEFCRSHPLLPALLSRDRALQLERMRGVQTDRLEPHRRLVASILERGIESGELQSALDVRSVADLICLIQAEYWSRSYTDDPKFPATPRAIDAVSRFIEDAVRAR